MSTILALRLTPRSDWVTPLQADTIFGHLCWKIKRDGESVDDFLDEMGADEGPPFVISNVFPDGFLPRPRFAWEFVREEKMSDVEADGLGEKKKRMNEVSDTMKSYAKETAFVRASELTDFSSFAEDSSGDAAKRLFDRMREYESEIRAHKERGKTLEERRCLEPGTSVSGEYPYDREIKTSIDRRTNTTLEEQGPYSLPVYRKRQKLWLLLNILDEDRFAKLNARFHIRENIRKVFEEGFGKRKSIGKGVFFVSGKVSAENADKENADGKKYGDSEGDFWKPSGIQETENGTHILLLSHFSPAQTDPMDGLYELFVKYGKLGEERSIAGGGNFYKKPILFIKEGATFSVSKENGQPKIPKFLGRMIGGVCGDERSSIWQYAYGFPLCF